MSPSAPRHAFPPGVLEAHHQRQERLAAITAEALPLVGEVACLAAQARLGGFLTDQEAYRQIAAALAQAVELGGEQGLALASRLLTLLARLDQPAS